MQSLQNQLEAKIGREFEILEVRGGYIVDYFNFNLKDRSVLIGLTPVDAITKCLEHHKGDTDDSGN